MKAPSQTPIKARKSTRPIRLVINADAPARSDSRVIDSTSNFLGPSTLMAAPMNRAEPPHANARMADSMLKS
ncbi:hypothetical protein D3C71_1779900 [compost metagenome]